MSLFALNGKGERTYISQVRQKEQYYCQICHQKLYIKGGNKVIRHFSHYPNRKCPDTFHYEEMSQWHQDWQEKFPLNTRETVIETKAEKHRADVFLAKPKTIIEFQHSHMTSREFSKRNSFYQSLGNRIVWLFDLQKEYAANNLKEDEKRPGCFKFISPYSTFEDFDCQNGPVTLFFQIKSNEILLVKWVSDRGFYYFSAYKISPVQFIKMCKGTLSKEDLLMCFPKKSIPYLFKHYRCKVMIVKNTITDYKFMLNKDPEEQFNKYHRIYGRKEDSFGEFAKKSEPIENALSPIWKMAWHKL